ncbi:LysE family translocator, partial [bacterium]|nr:LysE family translocator [bacterium]
ALVMSASHLVLATAYYLLVVVGVASFRLWLTQPKIWAWLQGLSGTILLALGARILLSKQEVS